MASEAGIWRCPNCGGDVAEAARACGYCRAELGTVRCHHCYAMNAARSLHCSACGRELGLEPVGGEDERRCPSCKKPLVAFSGVGGLLLDCPSSCGQFVEHDLLRSLLEEREVTGLAVTRRVHRTPLAPGKVRYVPCPDCKELMNRQNFGGESGVVVDVCSAHGTWFDDGELPRVLAFVESGGLVAAQARKRDRNRQEERAHAVRMSTLPTQSSRSGAFVQPREMENIADATMELVEWLASLVKKG